MPPQQSRTGTFGRAAFTLGSISSPLMPGSASGAAIID